MDQRPAAPSSLAPGADGREAGPPPPEEDGPLWTPPEGRVVRRHRFALIWLVPIVAGAIAAWLAWHTLAERGPLITIVFESGAGLAAGQTKVKHKSVDLGTVESVDLSRDLRHVMVRVRMRAEAAPYLTDQARFWVVRPRLTAGTVSGLETLVSGSYIELDPGLPDGKRQTEFTGLEEPPGVRSDQPGRTFTLKAGRIGSLGPGAPVFYRDVAVGEVLGYDPPSMGDPIIVHVFVRAPFDRYVRAGTHFWNASGVRLELGGEGLHLQLESLQAAISGGVAFATPPEARGGPEAPEGAVFRLYPDEDAAVNAGQTERIPFVSYFDGPVSGLAAGAPVQLLGLRVGTVTSVTLQLDPADGRARVRVAYDVQPGRVLPQGDTPPGDPGEIARRFVARGMRAEIETVSYVTGQVALALAFAPDARPAEAGREGEAIVIPGQGGGVANILASVNDVVAKLDRLPLDRIGDSLDHTLRSLDEAVSGPELKQTLRSVSATMADVQGLVRQADAGLTPALRRLPEIAAELEKTIGRANRLVGGLDASYGASSDFGRNLDRLMAQLADTARSIRLLADFLDRHPEALVRGRARSGAE